MKPRPESAPLTEEDKYANAVFAVIRGISEFRGLVLGLSYDADRRDALLMWRAQNWPTLAIVWMEQEEKGVTYAECIDVRAAPTDPEWAF